MTAAHINRIATAVPPHDVHAAFERFVDGRLEGRREQALFRRLARRSGIDHRWSSFRPVTNPDGFVADAEGFYVPGAFPGTARRMERYGDVAPALAEEAVRRLETDLKRVSHLVVASCTGFMAPGLDQVLVRRLGLNPGVERTVVGYMGCYAAVNSLRLAHHFVRSDPDAEVLVVNLELCTLHFQDTGEIEKLLSMLLFGDGASAALVSARAEGLGLGDFLSLALPDSEDLITWDIGDTGFDMHLSGEVPRRIARALDGPAAAGLLRNRPADAFPLYAVHAGGRAILDAVEAGLALGQGTLDRSRAVLKAFGNMSSATLMFVLDRILGEPGGSGEPGLAMAFGPGMACETFTFEKR
ncbi:MAG: type III polyketide synthase [Thermaurantiacus sp.]